MPPIFVNRSTIFAKNLQTCTSGEFLLRSCLY